MKKLATFFYVLRKTFTSVEYYRDILEAPFKFSLKFFFTYFFFYSILVTGLITWSYLLPLNDFFTLVLPTELANVYPEELEITIQDGAVTTNVAEPYFVPMSKFEPLKQELEKRVLGTSTFDVKNLLVIDTQAKIEDFPQYQTVALLTKHHLSTMNEDGHIETIPLDKAKNLTINKQKIATWMQAITPYLSYLLPGLISLLLIGLWLALPAGKLFYNLWLAAILWLVARTMTRHLTYKKAFQLGLHFIVISTTFFSIWDLLGVELTYPFLETALLTVLGTLIIKHVVEPKTPVDHPSRVA